MSRATVCVCAPAFLGALDFGLLALAGPRIAADVGATGSAYPWLFSTSAFAYGTVVLPAAALSGRCGAARALALGLAAAAGGTALLACSEALPLALAARALFGAGGALAATAALALLAALADETGRRAGAAALGGAVGGGFAAGALLAGLPGWRSVLLAVAAACAVLACVALRVPFGLPRPQAQRRAIPGAALLGAAVVVAAAVLTRPALVLALVGTAVAVLLVLVGWRRAAPWLPPDRAAVARVCGAGAATTASGVGATILTGTALAAAGAPGAVLGGFGLAVLPGAWLARSLARRGGHEPAAAAGLALQALALVALAAALAATPAGPLTAAAIVAFGLGHVVANAGTAGAVASLAGAAAPAVGALLVAAQYLGGGVAPVLIARDDVADGAPRGVLVAACVAAVGAAVVAGGRRRRPLPDAVSGGRRDARLPATVRARGTSVDRTAPGHRSDELVQ